MSWLTSRHAIAAVISRGARGELFVTREAQNSKAVQELIAQAKKAHIPVHSIHPRKLREEAGSSARGIALFSSPGRDLQQSHSAIVLRSWLEEEGRSENPGVILALDHITDPQNMGAILRSAHLFGVSLVIVPARRSATGGDAVLRASAGAAAMVPATIVPNLRSALEQCRAHGWWIYAADNGGDTLPNAQIHERCVLVLGAEGKGISPGIHAVMDSVITIPMRPQGHTTVDSLNVSVAAGILLYEINRRGR